MERLASALAQLQLAGIILLGIARTGSDDLILGDDLDISFFGSKIRLATSMTFSFVYDGPY